jgi:hypothetical protein
MPISPSEKPPSSPLRLVGRLPQSLQAAAREPPLEGEREAARDAHYAVRTARKRRGRWGRRPTREHSMACRTYRVEITRDESCPVRDTDHPDRRLHRPRSQRGQRRSARTLPAGHQADAMDQRELRWVTRKDSSGWDPHRFGTVVFRRPLRNGNTPGLSRTRDPSRLLPGYGAEETIRRNRTHAEEAPASFRETRRWAAVMPSRLPPIE